MGTPARLACDGSARFGTVRVADPNRYSGGQSARDVRTPEQKCGQSAYVDNPHGAVSPDVEFVMPLYVVPRLPLTALSNLFVPFQAAAQSEWLWRGFWTDSIDVSALFRGFVPGDGFL